MSAVTIIGSNKRVTSFLVPKSDRDAFRTMCFIEGMTGEAFLRECMSKFSAGELTPLANPSNKHESDQVNVSVRLEDDQLKTFKAACKSARLRQSDVLRAFILDGVEQARMSGMTLDIRNKAGE